MEDGAVADGGGYDEEFDFPDDAIELTEDEPGENGYVEPIVVQNDDPAEDGFDPTGPEAAVDGGDVLEDETEPEDDEADDGGDGDRNPDGDDSTPEDDAEDDVDAGMAGGTPAPGLSSAGGPPAAGGAGDAAPRPEKTGRGPDARPHGGGIHALLDGLRERLGGLSGLRERLKSEIGVEDGDDVRPTPKPVPPESHEGATHVKAPKARHGFHPWRRLRRALGKVSRLRRTIYVTSSLLACLAGAWTVPNLHAAFNPSTASFENNEGTVTLSDVEYADGRVSFTAVNDSDMIAHVMMKADVKAWHPEPSHPSSLFAPATIMGCGEKHADIDPGGKERVTMECHGGSGVWKRPVVEVVSE